MYPIKGGNIVNEFSKYYIGKRRFLENRHHIRRANNGTYWFQCYKDNIEFYRGRYNDDFYLIIVGSDQKVDDYYIIPFNYVKHLFRSDNINTSGNKPRWCGDIKFNHYCLWLKHNDPYDKYPDVRQFRGNLNSTLKKN
jgi:hypothetical protein